MKPLSEAENVPATFPGLLGVNSGPTPGVIGTKPGTTVPPEIVIGLGLRRADDQSHGGSGKNLFHPEFSREANGQCATRGERIRRR